MDDRAPLWRPLVFASGVITLLVLIAVNAERPSLGLTLQYVFLGGCYTAGAMFAWGLQRWRRRRMSWEVEVWVSGAVMMLLFLVVFPAISRVWQNLTAW